MSALTAEALPTRRITFLRGASWMHLCPMSLSLELICNGYSLSDGISTIYVIIPQNVIVTL